MNGKLAGHAEFGAPASQKAGRRMQMLSTPAFDWLYLCGDGNQRGGALSSYQITVLLTVEETLAAMQRATEITLTIGPCGAAG